MQNHAYVERLVNLLDPAGNVIFNMSVEDAIERVGSGDAARVREIDGQFALMHRNGKTVRLARSIGRPLRYFLAKLIDGPCLIVAERIDEIAAWLKQEGLDDQFHPSYTRMVPAHHIVELALVGCPDPNPKLTRYFDPQRNRLSTNLDEIGRQYIGALADECSKWLDRIDSDDATQPIGVLFSGGIDSGAVFLTLYHLLKQRGGNLSRLKAFTLSVTEDDQPEEHSSEELCAEELCAEELCAEELCAEELCAEELCAEELCADAQQALRFLDETDLSMFGEVVCVPRSELDYRDTIRIIEDYKPLDVQAATMGVALCRGIRQRYPDWKYLADGDGGDENLKDYPIEENPELTIRSVLNNQMLYHEGWGVDAIKHSLTFSGGQSRGHVRTSAPARQFDFSGFSPFALPNVIEVAEGIPFIELTDWDHDKLYALKGEVVRRGVETITGITMPVFEKRRFQHGAAEQSTFNETFPANELAYRNTFAEIFAK
ncbi:MAG: asparagine synthase-related protein [Planctomycetota bacterium]|jgi:asparagine synthase (glutamine-hydrolysing)